MRGVGCGVLLACLMGSLAFRQKDTVYSNKDPFYNSKDLLYSKDAVYSTNTFPIDVKRYDLLGPEEVLPCPVCPGDECEKLNGHYFKVCRYGTHVNYGCNARLDCYRGPGEICNEERSWQCERSLSCRDNQCRGFSMFGTYEHPNYAGKDH